MKHLNLIRKIAWSFYHTTRLDYNDLFSEAIQSYYKALEKYNPAKSKITTYIHLYITLDMINYLKKQKSIYDPLLVLNKTDVVNFVSNDDNSFFEQLSSDANVISNIVIEHSDKFIHLNLIDVEFLIIKIMKKQHWSVKRIKAGIEEIKTACVNTIE